jgi:hypothetical protein
VLKVVDQGLVLHRSAYLRDPWNVLDCIIVHISILSIVFDGGNIRSVHTRAHPDAPTRTLAITHAPTHPHTSGCAHARAHS